MMRGRKSRQGIRAEPSLDVDLLVMGAGCAGMVTALFAAVLGRKVLIVEKTGRIGGTSAYSSGTAWIPGTELADGCNPPDSASNALSYLDWMVGTNEGRELRTAFVDSGRDAVAFLQSRTNVQFFLPSSAPDYTDGPGAVGGGRAIVAKEFDGRLLGSDFALVREPRPGFDVLGGMMVSRTDMDALLAPFSSFKAFSHVRRILLRHFSDRLRWRRGTRLVMGNALIARLLFDLRRLGVPIHLNTSAVRLSADDGRVSGAVLRSAGGNEVAVRARMGVVLATGGISGNAKLRNKFFPEHDLGLTLTASGATGDGATLAVATGASIDGAKHRSGAFWMPTSVYNARAHDLPSARAVLFPHIVLDRAKPGLIAVNARGLRFVNEASSYHEFVDAMLASPEIGPRKPAWLICDAAFIWLYGLGLVRPWQLSLRRHLKAGYLRRASTLLELAKDIGVDPAGLADTVARHNGFAATGRDEEFGRGSTRLNRQNGDSSRSPNPCLAPIDRSPFYAVAVWPADLAASAGIRTDADARVLNGGGEAIAGLYAIGNDMASIMKGTYPGPGTTLGPAIVFGYRAVQHMHANQHATASS